MPTYEYTCENCGESIERFQSMSARPLRKCPSCGKNALKRLIGAGSGVIFKGSGFYETDYRSDSYKKAHEKEKTAGSKSSDKKSGDKKSGDKKTTAGEKKLGSTAHDTKADSGKSKSTPKAEKK